MGKAIIVYGADFSDCGYGKVTISSVTPVPVLSISINANASYEGSSFILNVDYTPKNTTLRGVRWEIIDGNDYATINEGTGAVNILTTTTLQIKVKATSIVSPTVVSPIVTISVKKTEEGGDIPTPTTNEWLMGLRNMSLEGIELQYTTFSKDKNVYMHNLSVYNSKTSGKLANKLAVYRPNEAKDTIKVYILNTRRTDSTSALTSTDYTLLTEYTENLHAGWNEFTLPSTLNLDTLEIFINGTFSFTTNMSNSIGWNSYYTNSRRDLPNGTLLYDLKLES